MKPRVIAPLLLCLGALAGAADRANPNPPEPEVISLFPQAGPKSGMWEAEITGKNLDGAYAVWFSKPGVHGAVWKVEEVKPSGDQPQDKKTDRDYKITIQLSAQPSARPGVHFLRLVSEGGVSNPVQFRVYEGRPVTGESSEPHEFPRQAQPITVPVVVNGRIEKPGEVDYYSIEVSKGQELVFDVISSREAAATGFHPQMTLYRLAESWFNPERVNRIAFTDRLQGESVIIDNDPRNKTGTWVNLRHRFAEPGRYYLEVGSLYGKGGPENIYQLVVSESVDTVPPEFWQQHLWQERSFSRKLGASYLKLLETRTAAQTRHSGPSVPISSSKEAGALKAESAAAELPEISEELAVVQEKEPNDFETQALQVSVPVILEGVIDREADTDTFRFKASRGQKLTFEIETPQAAPPAFNPRLDVFDSKGVEFLTNLKQAPEYKNPTTPYLISLDPKVVATFEQEGEYYLKVRDVTNRSGNSTFRYRVLIRPQIPHVGDIIAETRTRGAEDGRLDPWRLNIRPGEAKKLSVTVDHEEGFYHPANLISVQVEGLPPGVTVLPGSSSPAVDSRFTGPAIQKAERYLPKSQNILIVLEASEGAPATKMPVLARVTARAYVNGTPGPSFPIGELPVMVLKAASSTDSAGASAIP